MVMVLRFLPCTGFAVYHWGPAMNARLCSTCDVENPCNHTHGSFSHRPVIFGLILSEGIIDLPHDPLSPLNARSNQFVRSRASLRPSEQIIGGSHVQTRQDRGHDADHSFAAFVHDWGMILYSLYIRYRALGPMQKNKINRAKVLAALNTTCPSCGFSISPAEVVRIDFERMRCPKCGAIFEPGEVRKAD
jgi:predicted RNA-binding Zn-ribbon protein involved in translation (DUF1610 family)